jgi:hypothetical protein
MVGVVRPLLKWTTERIDAIPDTCRTTAATT